MYVLSNPTPTPTPTPNPNPKAMGYFECSHERETMTACYKHKGVCDGSMHQLHYSNYQDYDYEEYNYGEYEDYYDDYHGPY
jgi:hypothetical protein